VGGEGAAAAISAAVSGVVTTVVGLFLQWGQRTADLIRRLLVPDHVPITVGAGSLMVSLSPEQRVLVTVACAPSRSLRLKTVDPDEALDFLQNCFPAYVGRAPDYSSSVSEVRFKRADGTYGTGLAASVSGRIDYSVFADTQADESTVSVQVVDLLRSLLTMQRAISSPEYRRVYPDRRAAPPYKFDWFFSVSPGAILPNGASTSSIQLLWPDVAPRHSSPNQPDSCPPAGYGADRLRSWDMRRGQGEKLLRAVLEEFLQQNGYYDFQVAVDQATALALTPEKA
jgi:hypothetical protein